MSSLMLLVHAIPHRWVPTIAGLMTIGVSGCGASAKSAATARLFQAIEQQDVAAVKSTIERGADVNYLGPVRIDEDTVLNDMTPLHHAVFKGNCAIVELLLASGASIRANENEVTCTLRPDALGNPRAPIRVIVREKTPLHTAVRGGHIDIIRLLIAKGADVNARTKEEHKTPLHIAADTSPDDAEKYGPIVELLIGAGADVNATASMWVSESPTVVTTPQGDLRAVHVQSYRTTATKTPADFARRRNNSRIVAILGTHGGN